MVQKEIPCKVEFVEQICNRLNINIMKGIYILHAIASICTFWRTLERAANRRTELSQKQGMSSEVKYREETFPLVCLIVDV